MCKPNKNGKGGLLERIKAMKGQRKPQPLPTAPTGSNLVIP